MMEVAKIFVTGVVTIGIATALFLPGRQTAQVLTAGFKGSSGLLNTAIRG